MKKALVIGAAGFVGPYLIRQIISSRDWEVFATKMPGEEVPVEGITVYDLDLLKDGEASELLKKVRPDYIFHLAAQSSVALSWKKPDLTVDVNIKGSLHVLDAVRELDYSPRVLLIGSGEEYGHVSEEDIPITEDTLLRPGNLYAATKACQNMIGKIYQEAYDLDIMSVRAFNHIGPNQTPAFVVADFCKQVAEVEKGLKEPVMHVGNLSARRDFTDVRDVVRAYVDIMEKGKAGETYNVGSGRAEAIKDILDKILSLSDVDIKVETDPSRLRPVDVPVIEADINKLQACTGWEPAIPLEQTLTDTLEYWRDRV